MQKILLVHPDVALREKLTFVLQHSGFQVVGAGGEKDALAQVDGRQLDVIIMAEDTHKHNYNHEYDSDKLCVRLREACDAPIIVLGQEEKEAAGIGMLEMGADAYLSSPLNLRELLARVRSLLRRYQGSNTSHSRGYEEG